MNFRYEFPLFCEYINHINMERQTIISLLQEVLRGHERQAELLQRLKRSVSEEGNGKMFCLLFFKYN